MKKLSQKRKRFLDLRSKKKKEVKSKNIRSSRRQNSTETVLQRNYNRTISGRIPKKEEITHNTPVDFRILDNPDEIVAFIHKLKSYIPFTNSIKSIYISMRDVKFIDIGAICLLLSVIEDFSLKQVALFSSTPSDAKCREILKRSDYYSHMRAITSSSQKILETDNIILKRGGDTINAKTYGEIIKRTLLKLTGTERHYRPVYNMLNEMNLNSIEHAYESNYNNKHSFFSVYYEQEQDKVAFVFADNGRGILKTLEERFGERLLSKFNLSFDTDVLKAAFSKEYGTRFADQPNKGKGLPSIKEKQEKQKVMNLRVISNSVFLNLQNNSAIKLSKEFSGTFYYWEIDENCIS